MIHYIPASDGYYPTMRNNEFLIRDVEQPNQNGKNLILTGKDIFNSRKLICEKIFDKKQNYFESLAKQYLEDFKAQAPQNYKKNYHIIFPELEGFPRNIEIVKSKDLKLLIIKAFPFCYNNDWDKFYRLFKKTITSINGEEILENFEIFITETVEPFFEITTYKDEL